MAAATRPDYTFIQQAGPVVLEEELVNRPPPPPSSSSSSVPKSETGSVKDVEQFETAHPPHQADYRIDGGWKAWSTCAAGFIMLGCCLGHPNGFSVYQAHYKFVEFPDAPNLSISFINGTMQATLVLGCLFVGRPCELFGMRAVASVGSVIFVAALIAASFCSSVNTLIVTQGLMQGIGGAMMFVPATASPAPWFDKKRSLALGIAASGVGVFGLAWTYIIRACISSLGYRWSLRITAFVSAALCTVSILLMRTPPKVAKLSKAGSWRDSFEIFAREKWLIPLFAGIGICLFGYTVPQYYLTAYIESEAGASPVVGATINALINVGSIAGRIGMGFVADTRVGIMNAFVMGMSVAGVLSLIMWLPADGNVPVSFIYAFLYGFCAVGAVGISPAVLARHLDPNKLASISGIFFTCEVPGFLSGSPLSGAILSRTNGYRAVIAYSGSCMVLGSCVLVMARLMFNKNMWVKL